MIQAILTIVLIIVVSVFAAGMWWLADQYHRDKKSVMRFGQEISGGPCPRCDHPFDDHILVNRTGNPMEGGEMFCPVDDCECRSTWSVSFGKKVS